MDEEFKQKLRESLEAIDTRISALEHLVNDVIIGGLKDAADEYADDEAYSSFVDTYGDSYKDLEPYGKILNGDDFDMGSYLYETVKSKRDTEGFDELSEVTKLLDELKATIDAIKAEKGEEKQVEEKVEEEKPEEKAEEKANDDEEFDEQELRKIYRGE